LGDAKNPSISVISIIYSTQSITPFLAIHALETLGKPEAFVGILVGAQTAGSIVGNSIAGFFGDRFGGKYPSIIGKCSHLLIAITAILFANEFGFVAIFFTLGMAHSCTVVGDSTLSLEICPDNRRPTYTAFISSVSAVSMLLIGAISTYFRDTIENFTFSALLTTGFVIISLLCLFKVKEPRNSNSFR